MLNLLFIIYTHSNGGGAENVLTTLVNKLDPQKYNITIQEIYAFNVRQEPINDNIILRKRPLYKVDKKFDIFASTNFFFLYHNPKVLKTVFDWDGFDVVIAWNDREPSFALLGFDDELKINHFQGTPYFMDIKKYPENEICFERQVKVWNYVDKISTISNLAKKVALDICPQFANKIAFIHNGTDLEGIKEKSNLRLEKNVDALSADSVKLISIGSLDENKNFSLVLKSLAILKNKGFDFEYFILGKGKLLEQLRSEAADLNIQDNVHFLGYIQNPYPYLKACDILCVPSLSEGWSMATVEAMVLSKPFVTTPVAGASEELANNETCGLVSDWTPECFAEKLETLIKDKVLRDKMGKFGSEHIKNYSIERSIEEFEDLIKDAKKIVHRKNYARDFWNKILYYLFFGFSSSYSHLELMKIHIHAFFTYKKFIHIVAFGYRFVRFLISIIIMPVLFIPRLIVGTV